jgi:hypothetical protein
MFDTYIKVDYRQLLPSRSQQEDDELGIYEDDESRAQRRLEDGDGPSCPDWCNLLPSLSFRERLLGCATCMICGYLLGLGSFMRMKDLLVGNPIPLVVNVTLGNIIALCGTCFLTGPQEQLRRMFHETRRIASVAYLGCLAVTLLLLILPHYRGKGFMLFLLMIFQYVAITWYCLTYIPFARDILKRFCRRLVVSGEDDG